MESKKDRLTIIIQRANRRIITKAPLSSLDRLVFVINRQFTNAPNTTQIASGAGRSSAAGSNAAIHSPKTWQQQSVGAGGTAKNKGVKVGYGGYRNPHPSSKSHRRGKVLVVVINDQVVKLPKGQRNASATQVASGGGTFSTGGTNSAIESAGTRQQHAVGGGGTASNKLIGKRKKKRKHSR